MSKEVSAKKVTGKETFSKKRIIIGVALILVALLIGIMIVPRLSNKKTNYYVLVAKNDIEAGTRITERDYKQLLKLIVTDDPAVGASGYDKVEAVIGRYISRDLQKDTVITPAELVGDYKDIPEGKELIAMKVGAIEHDVAYIPKAGDIVRMYGTRQEWYWRVRWNGWLYNDNFTEAYAHELLQYVEVYRVLDSAGVDVTINKTVPYMMLFMVTHDQAKQIIEAQVGSNVYMSLVATKDATSPETIAKYLALQEKISEQQKAINDMVNGVPRETVVVPFSRFSEDSYKPQIGDVVRISYVTEVDVNEMDETGKMITNKSTRVFTHDLFKYVRVSDIMDAEGKSIQLPTDEHGDYDPVNGKVGLSLNDDQLEILKGMNKGELIITFVNEDAETIENGLTEIDNQIRFMSLEKLQSVIDAEAEKIKEEAEKEAEETSEEENKDESKEG